MFRSIIVWAALTATVLLGSAKAGTTPDPAAAVANDAAVLVGNGDGRIHMIPSISRPSVKNGEKITVSTVVKSQAPIAKVTADLGGHVTLELKAKPIAGLGNLPGGGFAAVYEGEWIAAGLEEKIYNVTISATDTKGHIFTDRSLQFSDPAAGTSSAGTSVTPTSGMAGTGQSLRFIPDYFLTSAVIDADNGYAYFITQLAFSPGQVVKVFLGDGSNPPVRVGALTLKSGENSAFAAGIDTANGYAYIASGFNFIKVALGTGDSLPSRVGSLTLDLTDGGIAVGVIDLSKGYAYLGTGAFPGRVIKVTLGEGADIPARVGAAVLEPNENQPTCAVIDTINGYAYFGVSFSNPGDGIGKVVKVALGDGSNPPTRVGAVMLNSGEGYLSAAVIDAAQGYAYFGAGNFVIKVALGAGEGLPIRVGALELNSVGGIKAAVIDAEGGLAYFSFEGNAPGSLFKIALGPGASLPTLLGTAALQIEDGTPALGAAVIDADGGYAYIGTNRLPGRVVKVALGSDANPPVRVDALIMDSAEAFLWSSLMDAANGYAYFGTGDSPGKVMKVALAAGATHPTKVGTLTLNLGENRLVSGVIDADNGYAYFGTDSTPGQVIKVALGVGDELPTRVGAVTLDADENILDSAVIDAPSGYAYFGTRTMPGRVVKVALGAGSDPPTRVGAVTLNADEDHLQAGAIDTANGYAYLGTNTSPGRVVKVALGVGIDPPSRVGAVTLNPEEEMLASVVMDAANGYAYFGTDTAPGRVVKISLGTGANPPTRDGALTLNSGENSLGSAVGNPDAGIAYFGTNEGPGLAARVVKVSLGIGAQPPTRLGALVRNDGEYYLRSAVLDDANGYAYFGTGTGPGQLIPISLRDPLRIRSTRMIMSEQGKVDDLRFYSHTAAGNVRLALYDDAPIRNLVWQSNSTTNTAAQDFISIPISSGTPSAVYLTTGTYHLSWQTDVAEGVPSFVSGGAEGSGYTLPYTEFGPYPTTINTNTTGFTTDENWTQFLTYATTTSAPSISVTPSVVSFGSVPQGLTTESNLMISNAGTEDLIVTGLTGLSAPFSLVNPPSLPRTLTPGTTETLVVRFSPSRLGALSTTLYVASNAPSQHRLPVALLGNGLPPTFSPLISNSFPSAAGWAALGQSGPLFITAIGSREYNAVNSALIANVAGSPRARIIGWIEDATSDLPYASVGSGKFVRAKYSMYYSGPGDSASASVANQVPNFRVSLRTRGIVSSQMEINHNSQIAGSPAQLNVTRELGPSKNPAAPSVYRVDLDPVDVPFWTESPAEGIQRGFETVVSGADYSFVTGSIALTDSTIGTYPALSDATAPVKIFATGGTDFNNANIGLARLGYSTAEIFRYIAGPSAADYFNPAILGFTINNEPGLTISQSTAGIIVNSTGIPTGRIGVADSAFIGGNGTDTNTTRLRIEPDKLYRVSIRLKHAGASDTTPYIRFNTRSVGFGYNATLELLGARGLPGLDARAGLAQVLPGTGNQVPGTTDDGTVYNLLFSTPLSPDIRADVAGSLTAKFPLLSAEPATGSTQASLRNVNFGFTVVDSLSIISTTATDAAEVANDLTLNRIEVRKYPQVTD